MTRRPFTLRRQLPRVQRQLPRALPILALTALLVPVSDAAADILPPAVVAGPSAQIVQVGNVAMSADGTGGIVWRQVYDGVPRIFVSRYDDHRWSAPIIADPDGSDPATFPTLAAANDGELLVAWVQPYASESTDGGTPTTVYELLSAELAPGSSSFASPEVIDDVGNGTGVTPSIAMSANGSAYIVYRVVTNPLTPGQPQPPGTISPMRSGDELLDVRVAAYNGLTWSSLGAVNQYPGEVTMREPTTSNAPAIGIDQTGQGMVVWQEPTIDGVARIWARRIFGSAFGNAMEVSPQTVDGKAVTADADAPALAFGAGANAEVAFRLRGASGTSPSRPADFINSISSGTDSTGGATFGGALPLGAGATVGAPSVATGPLGNFEAAWTKSQVAMSASGSGSNTEATEAMGPARDALAQAVLQPDGGDSLVWSGVSASGLPVIQVRETFTSGETQSGSLSAPISGTISDLTVGPSLAGDALVGWAQGSGATTQVVASAIQVPPHTFQILGAGGWHTPGHARLWWGLARTAIGGVRYSVVLDGRTVARDIDARHYRIPAALLGSGVYRVRVVATDSAGQETVTPTYELKIDAGPPSVSVQPLGGGRVRVRVTDRFSGVRRARTLISFGDGTRLLHGETDAVHRYAHRGRYRITVVCESGVGYRAVDHLLVRVL